MFRRLQSMFVWNAHHRIHNAHVESFYASPTARTIKRQEARRTFDNVLSRMNARL